MWTYGLDNYAPYASGSHNLNLKCTPRKAASFIVAGEISGNKRLTPYKTSRLTRTSLGLHALSFLRNLQYRRATAAYLYTGDVTWEPVKPCGEVNRIVGYGSSPPVNCRAPGFSSSRYD